MMRTSEERMRRIHELELKRQAGFHQTELVHRDEEVRRLKLRALTLRDENAILKDKVSQRDARIAVETKHKSKQRAERGEAESLLRSQEIRLKKQNVEIANLKAEIEALNSSMQDSGKALQEKFALTRELNRLQPEIEHLQSQLVSHQAVIAEKHKLQRELDSLEVELENEKRMNQRSRTKDDTQTTGDLRTRLEETEKRLNRAKKDHDKEIAGERDRNQKLEEQVSTLKSKLKEAQSEARKLQTELDANRPISANTNAIPSSPVKEDLHSRPKKKVAIQAQHGRKRRAVEPKDAMIAQTPEIAESEEKRPLKKRAADQALLGEKSTFSITPFLSRSKDLSQAPPRSEKQTAALIDNKRQPGTAAGSGLTTQHREESETRPEQEDDSETEPEPGEHHDLLPHQESEPDEPEIDSHTSFPKASELGEKTSEMPQQKPAKTRGRPRTKGLSEATGLKSNSSSNSAIKTGVQTTKGRRLQDMQKDDSAGSDEENQSPAASPPRDGKSIAMEPVDSQPSKDISAAKAAEGDIKKRKRKLLGGANRNIFDEDDGEALQKPLVTSGPAGRRMKAPLGGLNNAFSGTTFSPLKRQKRGAHTSFLA